MTTGGNARPVGEAVGVGATLVAAVVAVGVGDDTADVADGGRMTSTP